MKRLMRLTAAILAAFAAMPSAFADDVPFAQPPLAGAPVPLADIMAGVQLRHIKLGEAIKAHNWPLIRFEATLIGESLAGAALLYRNIPMDYVMAAATPLGELIAATGDSAKAAARFAALTAACNACHTAAEIPFIVIETPGSSPFSNQRFAPGTKPHDRR